MGALIMTTGLVIDGGQKVTAPAGPNRQQWGQSAAGNAAATQQLGGADPARAPCRCKGLFAAQPGVRQGRYRQWCSQVNTSAEVPTIFLSVIGIRSVSRTRFGARQHRAQRSLPMIIANPSASGRKRMTIDLEPRAKLLAGKVRGDQGTSRAVQLLRRSHPACRPGVTRSGSRSGSSRFAWAACSRT